MASLNSEAQAARLTARRLRQDTEELKLKVRLNVAVSRTRLGKAQAEADRALANRVASRPSPWSELAWIQTYETLEQTLVPLP